MIKKVLYLCGLPLQTPLFESNHEKKTSDKFQEGHSTEYRTSVPQSYQDRPKQGRSEKLNNQEEPK